MFNVFKRIDKAVLITCIIFGLVVIICTVVYNITDHSQNNNNFANTNTNISTSSLTDNNETAESSIVVPKTSLEIVQGWKWETEGNYTYIHGSVKNTGNTPISYFEVTAKYMDSSKNVLDSEFTNSNKTILPNEQQEFEIMHRYNKNYEYVRIYVNKVD